MYNWTWVWQVTTIFQYKLKVSFFLFACVWCACVIWRLESVSLFVSSGRLLSTISKSSWINKCNQCVYLLTSNFINHTGFGSGIRNYKREFFENRILQFTDYIAGVIRRSLELLEFWCTWGILIRCGQIIA